MSQAMVPDAVANVGVLRFARMTERKNVWQSDPALRLIATSRARKPREYSPY
jgi:hypothetical protein